MTLHVTASRSLHHAAHATAGTGHSRQSRRIRILRDLVDGGLGDEDESRDGGRRLQSRAGDLHRVVDAHLDHVAVLAVGAVQAFARSHALDALDYDAALEAGVLRDSAHRSFERLADDGDADLFVLVGRFHLVERGQSAHQSHAAAGDDALFDRRAGRLQGVLDAGLLLLELGLGRSAHLEHRHAAGQLSGALSRRIGGIYSALVDVMAHFHAVLDYPDEDIQAEQKKLNALYDRFTAKYGLISSRGNKLAFSEDSSYCLLCSLEVLDEQGNLKRKADMFSKRTIRPHVAVTSVDTASEALAVSISEKACVDMDYMAELSGKSPEELENELAGVIFRNIEGPENPDEQRGNSLSLQAFSLVTADEYLSGNVRRKLRMAKAFLEAAPDSQKEAARRQVEALEEVQPADLGAGEIGVRIGANWVPIDIYQQFMEELLTPGYYARNRIKILRSEVTGQWAITEKNSDRGNVKVLTTYGTKRMTAYHILEQTLNQKDVRVFDYIEDENGNKKAVLNKKETAIAQDRQELIKQKFSEWIWRDIDRRERLCRIYNETFNSIRPREYDGRHIHFEGMNPEISLRPHQINAIAHILYGGNTLLAHEVGAGKSATRS